LVDDVRDFSFVVEIVFFEIFKAKEKRLMEIWKKEVTGKFLRRGGRREEMNSHFVSQNDTLPPTRPMIFK
jgi:hypothetical protein